MDEILTELKEIKELLQVIASNQEQSTFLEQFELTKVTLPTPEGEKSFIQNIIDIEEILDESYILKKKN